MFHVKHVDKLNDDALLATIEELRDRVPELSTVTLERPWAIPAIISAAYSPISGITCHKSASDVARAAAATVVSLQPLSKGNRVFAGLVAILILKFAGEEISLEEAIDRGLVSQSNSLK